MLEVLWGAVMNDNFPFAGIEKLQERIDQLEAERAENERLRAQLSVIDEALGKFGRPDTEDRGVYLMRYELDRLRALVQGLPGLLNRLALDAEFRAVKVHKENLELSDICIDDADAARALAARIRGEQGELSSAEIECWQTLIPEEMMTVLERLANHAISHDYSLTRRKWDANVVRALVFRIREKEEGHDGRPG